MVKVVDIKGRKKKKKGITPKKLDFSGEDVGFMFQPRKPLTRLQLAKGVMASKRNEVIDKGNQPIVEDIIDLSLLKEEIILQRKGKEKVIEKTELQLLKANLREAKEEVIETKLELEEAKLDKKMVEEFKENVNDQINHYD